MARLALLADTRAALPPSRIGFSTAFMKIKLMEPTASETQDSVGAGGALPVIREHIVSTPGTFGGKPRIAGSRIQVKQVAIMDERQGISPEEIVSEYRTSRSPASTPIWPTTTTTGKR